MSLKAPWTDEQVEALNASQGDRRAHPFTCGNRARATHRKDPRTGDFGVLVATRDGWICPDCDYRQDWAHEFMCRPRPPLLVGNDWLRRGIENDPDLPFEAGKPVS